MEAKQDIGVLITRLQVCCTVLQPVSDEDIAKNRKEIRFLLRQIARVHSIPVTGED